MKPTNLLFLEDFSRLTCEAQVIDIFKENEKDIVILDQTVFYPQGGGQPYDQGRIISPSVEFNVIEVRIFDDVVKHIGTFKSHSFKNLETVTCYVDPEKRLLHSRIHSAGHVVDWAVNELKLGWVPTKGFHFPSGPSVEYAGNLENRDKEKLKTDLENLCNRFIKENAAIKLLFVEKEKLSSFCHFIPDYIPQDKPVRLIMFGNFAIPCGGTHVKNLVDIKSMTIRKIKMEKGNIRVSYFVA